MIVIIPIKDERNTIRETVKHIRNYLDSNYKDYNILIIDDGSTDGTDKVLQELTDEKIRTFPNNFDNGKGSALKTGYIISTLIYSQQPYDSIIFMDGDPYDLAVTGQGFVDRVVHDLINKMVKARFPGRTDIHGRPFSDGLDPSQDLYF